MKYLWRLYYLFTKSPESKSDWSIKYCRVHGKPYKILKLSRQFKEEDDL